MSRIRSGLLLTGLLYSFAASSQQPDAGFGNNGIVIAPLGKNILAMALQADQKIVTAGYFTNVMQPQFHVARYHADGSTDATFNGTGYVQTEISFTSTPEAIIVQPDGKILVGGNYMDGDFAPVYHPCMVRYRSDGTLDESFGTNGIMKDVVDFSEQLKDMVLLPDGKILAGGQVSGLDNMARSRFMLLRYKADGTRDSSFGTNGVVVTTIGTDAAIADISLLPDGRIIAGGRMGIHDPSAAAYIGCVLAKYQSDGSLDPTFGTGGIAAADHTPDMSEMLQSIVVLPDGKILAGGSWAQNMTIARYTPSGSTDAGFGNNGVVVRSSVAASLQLQPRPDGRFLVGAAMADSENDADFFVHAYTAGGDIDSAFGQDGSLSTNIGDLAPTTNDVLQCILLQPDGKLLAGGGSSGRGCMVRYNMDGSTSIPEPGAHDLHNSVYPNPFTDRLFVRLEPNQQNRWITLQLTDLLGRNMVKETISLQPGINALALPALSTGNYLLRVQSSNGKTWSTQLNRQ